MNKLAELFQQPQSVSLISESDTHVALSMVDQRTGEVKRLDISADMAVLPDEAVLSVKVSNVPTVDLFRNWNMRSDTFTDDAWPIVNDSNEPEPPATWTITPDGQEIDLRGEGLF